jgi:signal transduction histidine kinase
VTHMSRLVDDLLDSALVGTRKFQVTMSCVDNVGVLSRSVETSRLAMETRHQQLTMSLPANPLNIEADAIRLTQVFCNLLDNASKYTPDGGEVSLTCEPSNDAVAITVSDNGIGIAPARLATLFDLFAHDECGSATRGGLGIGLQVVRDLVEAHGGTVVARSPGENLGSQFSVTLPIRRGSVQASGKQIR